MKLKELRPISGVYAITNGITGKSYIGQSVNVIKRWCDHVEHLTAGTHTNRELQKDWNLYGPDCFSAKIILRCEPSVLLKQESRCIAEYRGLAGVYNVGTKISANETTEAILRAA